MPTNDWWSSLLWKKTDCSFGEPLFAHPMSLRQPFGDGLGFSYTDHRRRSPAPRPGSASTTTPTPGHPRSASPGSTHRTSRSTAGPTGPSPRTGATAPGPCKATIGHGLPFAYFQVTGGRRADHRPAARPTVWSNSGGTHRLHRPRPRLRRVRPDRRHLDRVSGTTITSTLAGKGYFSVARAADHRRPRTADRAALATTYGQYAHAHVTGTRCRYTYNQATSTVNTTYAFTTTAREGTGAGTVVGALPAPVEGARRRDPDRADLRRRRAAR